MGVSIRGQISFGILLEEDRMAWDKYDDGIYDWWIESVCQFKPSTNVIGKDGEYIPEASQSDIDVYWSQRDKFRSEHPLPIELVNVSTSSDPQYIVAVPDSIVTGEWGYPNTFDPTALKVTDEQIAVVVDFCKTHNLETVSEPMWHLSAYRD